MIPFIVSYLKNDKTVEKKVRHYTVPQVGEKVIPPDEQEALTVLTVEHDLGENLIWVILS